MVFFTEGIYCSHCFCWKWSRLSHAMLCKATISCAITAFCITTALQNVEMMWKIPNFGFDEGSMNMVSISTSTLGLGKRCLIATSNYGMSICTNDGDLSVLNVIWNRGAAELRNTAKVNLNYRINIAKCQKKIHPRRPISCLYARLHWLALTAATIIYVSSLRAEEDNCLVLYSAWSFDQHRSQFCHLPDGNIISNHESHR